MNDTNSTYFWHDYETFGTDTRRDRPAQFAGIRTDLALQPVADPVVEFCQPCDDLLPHPQACLITGITPQDALAQGMPEPDFARRILSELGAPGTCGVGYNSLRFDDEVTRHLLWRNFFDPYAREWRDGCSRWDIIDMVRLTYALRPEGIEWPLRDDGQPSFRLEDLAAANELGQRRAHDALSDVETTIALARLIRDRQPRLFDFLVNSRGKVAARSALDADSHQPVVHVSARFPAAQGCLSPVMPLVPHPKNGNAVLVYDLRHDPQDLLDLPAEDIHELIYTPTADLPDGVERVALKAVHLNKCPVLAPMSTLNTAQAERLQLDLDRCQRHWQMIMARIDEVAAKVRAVYSMGEFPPPSDPEQDLYGGFVGPGDRKLCDRITRLAPDEIEQFKPTFDDARLTELWLRYRARHFPHCLDGEERELWRRLRGRRLQFAADGGLALDDYFVLIDELTSVHVGQAEAQSVLLQLRDWGERLTQGLD